MPSIGARLPASDRIRLKAEHFQQLMQQKLPEELCGALFDCRNLYWKTRTDRYGEKSAPGTFEEAAAKLDTLWGEHCKKKGEEETTFISGPCAAATGHQAVTEQFVGSGFFGTAHSSFDYDCSLSQQENSPLGGGRKEVVIKRTARADLISKERMILEKLDHPGIIKLLGHAGNELLLQHGGTAYGSIQKTYQIRKLQEFIKRELELNLEDYRYYSPFCRASREKSSSPGFSLSDSVETEARCNNPDLFLSQFESSICFLSEFKDKNGTSVGDCVTEYFSNFLQKINTNSQDDAACIARKKDKVWTDCVYKGKPSFFNFGQDMCFFHQMALAVEYLKSRDIEHRDLHQQNIVIDKTGRLRLIDFGCAGLKGVEEVPLEDSATYADFLVSDDISLLVGVKQAIRLHEGEVECEKYKEHIQAILEAEDMDAKTLAEKLSCFRPAFPDGWDPAITGKYPAESGKVDLAKLNLAKLKLAEPLFQVRPNTGKGQIDQEMPA